VVRGWEWRRAVTSPFVMLNLFQHPSHASGKILKQVQDDEIWGKLREVYGAMGKYEEGRANGGIAARRLRDKQKTRD